MASILSVRLNAGAENRIWNTQFGFESKSETIDALFMARRLIQNTVSGKDRTCILLALDWAKAFGSILPDGLADALRRCGLPGHFIELLRNIYEGRNFLSKT